MSDELNVSEDELRASFGPPCPHEQDGNSLTCPRCRQDDLDGTLARLPEWLRAQCCAPSEPWVGGEREGWGHDHGHTYCLFLNLAADELDRSRRALRKMADAAGEAWTPRWVLESPWFEPSEPNTGVSVTEQLNTPVNVSEPDPICSEGDE